MGNTDLFVASQALPASQHQGAALKAYRDTVKRRNAEVGLRAVPRRASPVAPICGVAVLAKATDLRLRTAPCNWALQGPLRRDE